MPKERFRSLTVLAFVFILSLSLPADANQKEKKKKQVAHGTPVLWREPTDIASRDLLLGPGGKRMKPDL